MSAPDRSVVALWRELARRPPGPPALTSEERHLVVGGIRTLSKGFGGGRNLAGHRYLDDPALLGAYLLFFGPISQAQARSALQRSGFSGGGRALDVGTGSGPVARALLQSGIAEVVGLDHSDRALQVAKAWVGPAFHARTWDAEGEASLPEGPFRLVSLGHTVNELWKRDPDRIARRVAFFGRLAERLAPDGQVLVIEPASHAINREMLELRDALVLQGWAVDAPCFFRGPCPALAEGVACHAEVAWKPPRELTTLANEAHLSKDTLAFGWLLVRPPAERPPLDPTLVRVVSERLKNKAGRERFVVCGATGRFSLSAPSVRDASWKSRWRALSRGDAVRVSDPEERESGWGLQEGSQLEPMRGDGERGGS